MAPVRTVEQVILALGSNMGCREGQLARARLALGALIGPLRASPVYASAAWLPEGAPAHWKRRFLNQVVVGRTRLGPLPLLERLKRLERALDRRRRGHWGPREIDIDIVVLGGRRLDAARLSLPHPGWRGRGFVAQPLRDVWRDRPLPLPMRRCMPVRHGAARLGAGR